MLDSMERSEKNLKKRWISLWAHLTDNTPAAGY
jgi:hypothetical protein